MRHYILFLILFLSTGIGQIKVLPMGEGAMRDAFLLEQKGELETAQKIYESIFIANPKKSAKLQPVETNLPKTGKTDRSCCINSRLAHSVPK